jgi:hypothetical protein
MNPTLLLELPPADLLNWLCRVLPEAGRYEAVYSTDNVAVARDLSRSRLLILVGPKPAAAEARAEIDNALRSGSVDGPVVEVEDVWLIDLRGSRSSSSAVLSAFRSVSHRVWRQPDLFRALEKTPASRHLVAWEPEPERLDRVLGVQEAALLRRLVVEELKADIHPKLTATGSGKVRGAPLARMFMDLPFIDARLESVHRLFGERSAGPSPKVVQHILKRLDLPPNHTTPAPRFVIFGGPGQGKTTVGTYLCQQFRAALLRPYRKRGSNDVAPGILKDLRTGPQAITRRIAVHIVLHKLADALAKGEAADAWEFVAQTASTRLDEPVSAEQYRRWLKDWPSVVVVDGLDEVPASANRVQTHQAVMHMLSDLEIAGADTAMVITTRPQGYRGELDGDGWDHLTLQDLTPEVALEYSHRLLGMWVPDRVRLKEMAERMRRTMEEPSARSITRSPLQVTILTVLVDQAGLPPREPWRLFREYFQIMLARERERGIDAVRVLRDHPGLVERLHAEVGWRLHLRAETSSHASSTMARDDLRFMVDQLLEDEADLSTRSDLADRLCEAALDRLVFLVGPAEGQIGFEIRSLQEFFASERLFLGPEELLLDRLAAISVANHWQNVRRFAVGRLLAERRHLAEGLLALCDRIEEQRGGGEAGLGLRLAVELLGFAAVTTHPKVRAALVDAVVTGMDGPRADVVWLALEPMPEESWGFVADEVEARAERGGSGALGLLWERGGWETSERSRAWVMAHLDLPQVAVAARPSSWVLWRLVLQRLGARVPPRNLRHYVTSQMHEDFHIIYFSEGIGNQNLKLKFVSDRFLSKISLKIPSYAHPDWNALAPVVTLWQNIGPAGLADSIRAAAALPEDQFGLLWQNAPWPLRSCLDPDREKMYTYATSAEQGLLGDAKDWFEMETRVARSGVQIADLKATLDAPPPWPRELATVGIPVSWLATVDVRGFDLAQALEAPAFERFLCTQWDPQPDAPADHPIWDRLSASSHWRALQILVREALNHPEDDMWADRISFWIRKNDDKDPSSLLLFNVSAEDLSSWVDDHAGTSRPSLQRLLLIHAHTHQNPEPAVLALEESEREPWTDVYLWTRASTVTPEEVPDLAPRIAENPDLFEPLFKILLTHRPSGAVDLLLALLALVGPNTGLTHTLGQVLADRASPLTDPAVAARLKLPGLSRIFAEMAPHISAPAPSPLLLSNVQIQGLRAWDNLTLDFTPPAEPGRGQLIVLLGENGAGKTTLLRGLALALARSEDAQACVVAVPGPLVRPRANEAWVRVQLDPEATVEVVLRERKLSNVKAGGENFVVAYGVRRGSILGGEDRGVDLTTVAAIRTLFVEGANLIHAETWLRTLDHRRTSKEPGAERVQQEVEALLKGLLPGVSRVQISPNGVMVEGLAGEPVALEAMSDGYLTTAGWLLDLVARWLERERAALRPIPPDFTQQMTGVVLLDEADLHLHPRWQWSILEDVRQQFPRLTFVVTTHNPMTLLGVQEADVRVVTRDEHGHLQISAHPLTQGIDVHQLLTGPWFNLVSTVDRETGRLMEEHRRALRDGAPEAVLRPLEAALSARLHRPVDTSLERLAMTAIAQSLPADRPPTPQDRDTALNRAVALLKRGRGGT